MGQRFCPRPSSGAWTWQCLPSKDVFEMNILVFCYFVTDDHKTLVAENKTGTFSLVLDVGSLQ